MYLRRRFAWLLTVMIAVAPYVARAAPGPSAAQKSAAREAYRKAQQAYNLGEYASALDAFKEAYRNVEDPAFLYNIGQCQRQLGDKPAAIRSFKAYLANSSAAANGAEVQRMTQELEAAQKAEEEAKATREREARASEERVRIERERALAAEHERLTVQQPAPAPKKPVYKKWWFWTAVGGGVVAVALGVGLGVGLTRDNLSFPSQTTSLGTVKF